jgi:hypothetical protein
VHGTPKRFTKRLIFSSLSGPQSGFFTFDQSPNTVPFWLSSAAIVQKMNVSSGSIDCYGAPEKNPEIKAARDFAQTLRLFSTGWHGLRNS